MKIRQKIYDSSEQTNKLIKITNSYHLYKNLEKIRNRKPIYINNPNSSLRKNSPRQKSLNDLKNYYKNQSDLIFGKIIEEINCKKIGPQINSEQNKLINNSRESRLIYKSLENKSLEKKNEQFKKRIYNQKPFISVKKLDKEYKRRLINEKIKKNSKSTTLILPPINKY